MVVIGALGIFLYLSMNWEKKATVAKESLWGDTEKVEKTQAEDYQYVAGQPVDMRYGASLAVKGVVHVKTRYMHKSQNNHPLFDFLFGSTMQSAPARVVMNAGSGVIISSDGYIVTNNHVISRSENIEVVLNDKRAFPATLVGKDPNTDLALLKIEANDLDTIAFANSDHIALGEWVMAVGNPYNLTSTVTAGIVSAKARSISNPGESRMNIDAFIQTDAAVNSGNSGGALVNTKGELVGINTAIQSKTGSYVGYSFAVPSNIVAKVTADLKQFGEVQRAYLGVEILTVTDEVAKEYNLQSTEGVFVANVNSGGAAEQGGLQANDVIVAINGKEINSVEQLQEQMGKFNPNDKIEISVKRANIVKHFQIELRNTIGGLSKRGELKVFGGTLVNINDRLKETLGLNGGVVVLEAGRGALYQARVKRGFIIQTINNAQIVNVDDIVKSMESNVLGGQFLIDGVYPDGTKVYYKIVEK